MAHPTTEVPSNIMTTIHEQTIPDIDNQGEENQFSNVERITRIALAVISFALATLCLVILCTTGHPLAAVGVGVFTIVGALLLPLSSDKVKKIQHDRLPIPHNDVSSDDFHVSPQHVNTVPVIVYPNVDPPSWKKPK